MPFRKHPTPSPALASLFAQFLRAGQIAQTQRVDLIRPEGRLMAHLLLNGPQTMKQAMSVSECSYRGFYLMIARLEADNIITVAQSNDDKRVKYIHFNPDFLAQLENNV